MIKIKREIVTERKSERERRIEERERWIKERKSERERERKSVRGI